METRHFMKNIKKYIVALDKETNECGIFTTIAAVSRFLSISSRTIFRGLESGDIIDNKSYYIRKDICITKSNGHGNDNFSNIRKV